MTPSPPAPADRSIALALSGGGFRATLFHLGVVRFLYETKRLADVTHITSVSGGSILAAHLVLNWERYTSTDKNEFDAAAAELVRFAQWDLRGRVVRPWLWSCVALGIPRLIMRRRWWRTALLQAGYDRLFRFDGRPAVLDDLARPGRPELHLLATSMTTGQLASFGRHEFRLNASPEPHRNETPAAVPAGQVAVSLAVAASSAFPPLFPPVRIDRHTFRATSNDFHDAHYLADGGVFDNLGVRKLVWLTQEAGAVFGTVVVSDAQQVFSKDFETEYSLVISRASRSVDLMMDRVSDFEGVALESLARGANGRLVRCRLQKRVTDLGSRLNDPAQFAVQNVRTDLDAFTGVEVNALVQQGTQVAWQAWNENKATDNPPAPAPWRPVSAADPNAIDIELTGRHRYGLFRLSDWASWALVGTVLCYLGGVTMSVIKWNESNVTEATDRVQQLADKNNDLEKQNSKKNLDGGIVVANALTPIINTDHPVEFLVNRKVDISVDGKVATRVVQARVPLYVKTPTADDIRWASRLTEKGARLDEIEQIAERLADQKTTQFADAATARDRFVILYLLVRRDSDKKVLDQMDRILDPLDRWERKGVADDALKAELRSAANALKAVCQAERMAPVRGPGKSGDAVLP